MNTYQINKEQALVFSTTFHQTYKHFMDYGGEIYHDKDVSIRITKLLYSCAICNNMNWDFLCSKAIPLLYDATAGFSYESVCNISEPQFEEFFKEYPKKHKIEAAKRISMLKSLSYYLCEEDTNRLSEIINSKSLSGDKGLLNLINSLPVFSDDPLHKKGNLLAQILLREGIIKVDDEYNMEPSIDYHVIRFFLRTGLVTVTDINTFTRLQEGDTFSLDEVTLLRKTIADCMKYIFEESGISIAKQGFIAWTVGRDYCRNTMANCDKGLSCPIMNTCKGKEDSCLRKLKEPVSNVGFY